jgi:hypothetical protein
VSIQSRLDLFDVQLSSAGTPAPLGCEVRAMSADVPRTCGAGGDADACRVVLDTSPARDLAHALEAPEWTRTFALMRSDGYAFSLADHAFGELMSQRKRNAIDDAGQRRMLAALQTFLDESFPVCLGEIDVMKTIGAEPGGGADHVAEASTLSRMEWAAFCSGAPLGGGIDEILEEDRSTWQALFPKIDAMLASARIDVCDLEKHSDEILQAMLRSHDQRAALTPPLSMRLDLQTRYSWRQYKRSRGRLSHRYDPTNRGKRNDGIDFNLYTYLALPALIVAGEGGFFGSIADITSFQREWIMRPATLAQAWERGERPRPLWPM